MGRSLIGRWHGSSFNPLVGHKSIWRWLHIEFRTSSAIAFNHSLAAMMGNTKRIGIIQNTLDAYWDFINWEEKVMLKGKSIVLRPVQEKDIDQLYIFHLEIDNRGSYFPRGVLSQPAFRKDFEETSGQVRTFLRDIPRWTTRQRRCNRSGQPLSALSVRNQANKQNSVGHSSWEPCLPAIGREMWFPAWRHSTRRMVQPGQTSGCWDLCHSAWWCNCRLKSLP